MDSLVGLVASFFGGWGAIAAACVVMAAVGLLLWRVRAGGASAAREKQLRHNAKVNEEMEDEMGRPVSRDDTVDRMRSGGF